MLKNRSANPSCKTTLIIAPVALIDQWKAEIEERTNCGLTCLIYHGKYLSALSGRLFLISCQAPPKLRGSRS